ncbi:MAG: CoA transferase [Novosphingobium sp.]|nr:CoA transferase [Novosphingobium sp.]
MSTTAGPLRGIRVIDLSTIVAGPMATQIMADQGAEVIKVEAPPRGDGTRHLGPCRNGYGAAFHIYNRGKRSVVLDLKTPDGIEALRKLIATADVLLHNYRPKVTARLGIDYPSLAADHPHLVYVAISGFGEEGPLADRPAFDHIMQCYTGFASAQATQGSGGKPALAANIVCDKLTALTASQAVTAALLARARGDGGQEVKLSMLGAAIAFLWPDAAGSLHLQGEGAEWRPNLADRVRLYHFRNGSGTFNGTDASFAKLVELLDSETGRDPRLVNAAGRSAHPELMKLVDAEWAEATAKLDVDEGLEAIAATGAPCAKVRSLSDLVGDPQVDAMGYLRLVDHPVAGLIREPVPAASFSATPLDEGTPGPTLGQHTDEVLAELGYEPDKVSAMREAGALG